MWRSMSYTRVVINANDFQWLMYGAISCEPVAILDSAQAIELARALRGFRNGSAQDLITISQVRREWFRLQHLSNLT